MTDDSKQGLHNQIVQLYRGAARFAGLPGSWASRVIKWPVSWPLTKRTVTKARGEPFPSRNKNGPAAWMSTKSRSRSCWSVIRTSPRCVLTKNCRSWALPEVMALSNVACENSVGPEKRNGCNVLKRGLACRLKWITRRIRSTSRAKAAAACICSVICWRIHGVST